MRIALVVALLAGGGWCLLPVAGPSGPTGSAGSAGSAVPAVPGLVAAPAVLSYRPPVTSPLVVVRPFAPPVVRYGPGHLGVDLRVRPGATVRAAAAGTVSFAGQVAGRGLVVVLHADGIRTEYEPLRPVVHRGQQVAGGTALGVIHGTHGRCAPQRCLHWGARRGAIYLDPLSLLRALGPVRLLPWPGD